MKSLVVGLVLSAKRGAQFFDVVFQLLAREAFEAFHLIENEAAGSCVFHFAPLLRPLPLHGANIVSRKIVKTKFRPLTIFKTHEKP